MEEMIDSIRNELTRAFPGAETELEYFPDSEKVGGYLIWDGFDGLEQIERQRTLALNLRESMGAQYRTKVTTILTVTPAEVAVMREG